MLRELHAELGIPENYGQAGTRPKYEEAAELVEIFQWLTEPQSDVLDNDRRARAEAELADILIYLVRIADRLDVDLLQASARKLEENARKYPADRVRGQALKYDEYD